MKRITAQQILCSKTVSAMRTRLSAVGVRVSSMFAVESAEGIAVAAYAPAKGAKKTTHVNGLACLPAATKHDRTNNWQLRPLSLRSTTG